MDGTASEHHVHAHLLGPKHPQNHTTHTSSEKKVQSFDFADFVGWFCAVAFVLCIATFAVVMLVVFLIQQALETANKLLFCFSPSADTVPQGKKKSYNVDHLQVD
eukprot:6348260-Amphidinium_carterae.1